MNMYIKNKQQNNFFCRLMKSQSSPETQTQVNVFSLTILACAACQMDYAAQTNNYYFDQ